VADALSIPRHGSVPDVNVLRANGPGPGGQLAPEGAAVALTVRSQPVVSHVPHDPKKRTCVEVFHPRDGGRLVTTIEILTMIAAAQARGEPRRPSADGFSHARQRALAKAPRFSEELTSCWSIMGFFVRGQGLAPWSFTLVSKSNAAASPPSVSPRRLPLAAGGATRGKTGNQGSLRV